MNKTVSFRRALAPWKIATWLMMLLLPSLTQANEPSAEEKGSSSLWLTSGMRSYHLKRGYHYRQQNTGIGLEWRRSELWSITAGTYKNSFNVRSNYLQATYTPFYSTGPTDTWRWRAGMVMGVVNGYRNLNNGHYVPTLAPILSIESKHFGMDFLYVPSIQDRVTGALAARVKFRLSAQ